jgi:N-acetylglucosamine-6-phosphate deacetylase
MSDMRGFVDLQVNGFNGVGFTDLDVNEEALVTALRHLIADGTALFLPTLITAEEAVYARNLPLVARIITREEFAPHCPGFHLEGPFLSPTKGAAGAHNPGWMQEGSAALLTRLQTWADGRIRLLTIAPEIPGAITLIKQARQLGMVVSLGHHMAKSDIMSQAIDAGATALTHLGNGLPHMMERHHNPLIDGLAEDRLQAMIIGDGHHVPWNLLRVMLRAKGLARCCLVSDAAPIANHPPGAYACLGTTGVINDAGRLENQQTGYLLGSSYTIRRVVNATRNALQLCDADMWQLAVHNPLQLLGLPSSPIKELPRNAAGDWLPLSTPAMPAGDRVSPESQSC